ncbi:ribosome hibernation factor-recruiting GTPase MRF [Blastococcus sp. SYSU D00820]
MTTDQRTPVLLVTGLGRDLSGAAADVLGAAQPGTVVVHHDVRHLGAGVVVRTVAERGPQGPVVHREALELAHGCLSCTLRLDLLPLLRVLARRPDVLRVVVHLDPALEPEHLCWALDAVVLDDDAVETAGDSVRVEAVIAVLDAARWLDDATGEDTLADRGLAATADDERTLAQVAVGQAAFADAVLVAGRPESAWEAARLGAVLDRLLPGRPRAALESWRADPGALLAAIGPRARRGRVSNAHEPLLAGEPPLDDDAGVALVHLTADRPFHPERLHDALDVLLDGVVCSRGRLWLATRPDRALWLESAGSGLRIGDGGPWLASDPEDHELWARVEPERRVAAALRWHEVYGDRDVDVVVLTHRQSPAAVTAALRSALVTDEELAAGQSAWSRWPDPFGDWHEDPCEASTPAEGDGAHVPTREEHP